MSRTTVTKTNKEGETYQVAFGQDHALGFFVQVFQPGEEEPVYDKCWLFDHINAPGLIKEVVDQFGVDIYREVVGV